MQHYRYDGVAINLDPGAETVAYEAAIDVREKFTLTEIMEEYSLGLEESLDYVKTSLSKLL